MADPYSPDPHGIIAAVRKVGRFIRRLTWVVVAILLVLFLNLVHIGSAK